MTVPVGLVLTVAGHFLLLRVQPLTAGPTGQFGFLTCARCPVCPLSRLATVRSVPGFFME